MDKPLGSILDVLMRCPKCGWIGRAGDTDPDVDNDGSLGCPTCGGIVQEERNTSKEKINHG